MDYIKFSLFFILSHGTAYIIAGAIALKVSKDIYESRDRHCNFLRDMSDKEESMHVSIYFLPAQILRSFLMSVVLFPLLDALLKFSFITMVIFFSNLMFIYTHIAAVSPFIDNIEGFVYFKKKYFKKSIFLKLQLEMIIYSILFAILMALFIKNIF